MAIQKNVRNSPKFLLALQKVVLFVLFSLCWQHCKLVCDPIWPQPEISWEPVCFLLMIPLYGQKNRRYGLSHGVLALLLVVSAASHKWTSQWKWKLKNKNKKHVHSYRSFLKPQERIWLKETIVLASFLSCLFPALCLLYLCMQWTHGCGWKVLLLKFLAKPNCSAEADRLYGKVTMLTCGGEVSKIGGKERESRQKFDLFDPKMDFAIQIHSDKMLGRFCFHSNIGKKYILQPSKLSWSGTAVL